MKKLFVFIFAAGLIACGHTEQPSAAKEVDDIQSMSKRPDGQYDVRCQDGRFEVRSASEIRSGNVCRSGGGNSSLICVAKDNDGRDPWILATLNVNGTVTRLQGTQFSTIDQCRQSTAAARPLDRSVIVCIARDNDGRDPWVGAQIFLDTGTIQKIPDLSFSTLDQCTQGIGAGRPFRAQVILCAARDNDGRDPWILGRLGNGALTKIPETVFTTVDQCYRSLNSARSVGDALWVCGSRDRDGRDPWNLFAITTTSVNMLDLNYSSLDQCLSGN